MGFKTGAYCTVWSVETPSPARTKARISISRKNNEGGYDNEFGGFVNFCGTAVANKAARLKERDRIRLGDVDVKTFYSKEKDTTYYNFNVFSFETSEEMNGNSPQRSVQPSSPQPTVDSGDIDDELPWEK